MSALEAFKNEPSASKEEADAEAVGDEEGQDVNYTASPLTNNVH